MTQTMPSGRWRRLKDLFHRAAEGGPAARAAVLSALRDEESLRRELESLIEAHERGSDFLTNKDTLPYSTPVPASLISTEAGPPEEDEAFEGNDRFEIRERLGAGGFGTVYEAFDRERRMPVAVKVLHRRDAGALYRFKREFRSLAEVQHPNLVQLYDLVSDGRRWLLTMERVHGVDFLDHVRSAGGGADEERLRGALLQLARGVHALHEAGRLHGDVKSSNVLVTREGRVVLLDFGLVSDLAPETAQAPQVAGTPAYMPPEAASGVPPTAAGDWYSVGVMLYEALAGRLPFSGKARRVLAEKCATDPPPPSSCSRDVPADLESLAMEMLQRRPDRRPGGAEVLARLGSRPAGADAVPGTPSGAGILIGRGPQLTRLHQAFRASRSRLVTVHVRGVSGVGKTALLRRFLEELRSRESRLVLLTGRCFEHESVPYKALDGVIDSLSQFLRRLAPADVAPLVPDDGVRALVQLFPVLKQTGTLVEAGRREAYIPDPQESRRRALNALHRLLRRAGEHWPLVLCGDDLQWGDPETAGLLASLQRLPDAPAMLVVLAYRSEQAQESPFLRSLMAHGPPPRDVHSLDLAELTSEQAADMARALLGEGGGAPAEAIARESRGSPLFVAELVRSWRAGHAVPALAADGSPGSLAAMIGARVSHLAEPARRLLEVVSVAGQPVELGVARRAAGPESEDPGAVIALRNAHLVKTLRTESSDEIETYHDSVREAVLTRLAPEALRAHHGAVAAALAASGRAEAEALAIHFHAAGDLVRAGENAVRAAERAAETLAFARAARFYRLAIEIAGPGDPACGALHRELGTALANQGAAAEAAAAFLKAAERAGPDDAIDLRRKAGEQLMFSGRIDEGERVMGTVLAALGVAPPANRAAALARMTLRCGLARLRGWGYRERPAHEIAASELRRIDTYWAVALSVSDVVRGAEFQARNLVASLRAGEPRRVVRALCGEVLYSAIRGNAGRARAERVLLRARPIAAALDDPYSSALVECGESFIALQAGQWRRALALFDATRLTLRDRCTGVAWELDNCHYFHLSCLFQMGRIRELARATFALLRDALDRGDIYLATRPRVRLLATIHLSRDDPGAAREELARGMLPWSSRRFSLQHLNAIFGHVDTYLYSGEVDRAWTFVSGSWPAVRHSQVLRMQAMRIGALQVRARAAIAAACARGAGSSAAAALLRHARRDAAVLAGEGVDWSRAFAALLEAGAASACGGVDEALARADSAERQFEACDMMLHAAAARRRRGELLGGDAGKALRESADAWMAAEGIVDPQRMTAMVAPGRFADPA